jgi:antitoxin CcdA
MAERRSRSGQSKKATNVSLRLDLLNEARALGISISEAAEDGLARAIAQAHEKRWLEENRAAIESSNAYVEKHGLPLARYRQF